MTRYTTLAALTAGTLIGSFTAGALVQDARHSATPRSDSAAASRTDAATPTAAPAAATRWPIGTNLNGIASYSPQRPFVDLIKSARPWISGADGVWDDQRAIATDANGWVASLKPGQIARTLITDIRGGHYPAGRYVLTFDGEGDLAVEWDAAVVSKSPGRWVLELTPSSNGIHLMIRGTQPSNPLRNLRLVRVGGICAGKPATYVDGASRCAAGAFRSYEANRQIVFTPGFLAHLSGYSTLRFMDWGATNDSTLSRWADRAKVSDFTWATGRGVPYEIMIQLSRQTGADAWVTIPHRADDAYVRESAKLFKATLPAARSVYVEHSNEVWNNQFEQASFAASEAVRLGLSTQANYEGQLKYHALRTREIGALWHAAFGTQKARVVRVLGAQAANAWTISMPVDFLKTRFGSAGIDAAAIAPYFGHGVTSDSADGVVRGGLDPLFAAARGEFLPESKAWTVDARKVTSASNLRLIAYEGGQHSVGIFGAENNQALTDLLHAYNRDPRMYGVYRDYLQDWKDAGGELFVHFSDVGEYTKWGSWGAKEYILQPAQTAPKYRAIRDFASQTPIWW